MKNNHGWMSPLVKLHAYINYGNIRSNVNPDISIVTIFWLLVESMSHWENERNFTDRKIDGISVIIFLCITKSSNPR